MGESAHLYLCGCAGCERKDDDMGPAIAAAAVLPRERADQGCVDEQAGGDGHGEPRQGWHASLRVHDEVELSGWARVQHVAGGRGSKFAAEGEIGGHYATRKSTYVDARRAGGCCFDRALERSGANQLCGGSGQESRRGIEAHTANGGRASGPE